MSELAVRDETAVATQQASLPVPAMTDIDSWTHIVGQVIRLAGEIYDTPFIPDGLRGSAAAVAAAMLAGREMGLGPMTSLANIDVIRGKPTQKPLLMRAMILARGHKWEDVENNDTRAVVRGCRKGEATWTTVTFTADQARKAQLDLGKYPADKLYARASSRLAKHRFADVIMGMQSSDDVEDGADAEVDTTTGEVTGGTTTAPPADKPRTAQRRNRTAGPTAAAPASGSAQAPQSPQAQGPASAATAPSGDGLPPLPGEDEPAPPPAPAPDEPADPDGGANDIPGTVTGPQLKAIWTVLNGPFGFASNDGDKEAARVACGVIVNREVTSTTKLSFNDAKAILDTLGHWQHGAETHGGSPRDYMMDALQRIEEARDGQVHGGQQ